MHPDKHQTTPAAGTAGGTGHAHTPCQGCGRLTSQPALCPLLPQCRAGTALTAALAARVPDPWLSTQAHHRHDHIVAHIAGELDLATACTLHLFLHDLLAEQPRLVVNCAALAFTDAIGIRILLIAAEHAVEKSGWIRLAQVRPHLRQLLFTLGVTRMLPVYDTEAAAAHFSESSARGAARQ